MHAADEVPGTQPLTDGEHQLGQRLSGAWPDDGRAHHAAPLVDHQAREALGSALGDRPVQAGVPLGDVDARSGGPRLITLTTCAELFHTDDRMIAFGHLVDTEVKQPQ